MSEDDGEDERSLQPSERSRTVFWLLVAATLALGAYGCTRVVMGLGHPTPPERAVMRRSGDVVSVAMSACRGSVPPSQFEVLLADRGTLDGKWTRVYEGVPDRNGWMSLPDDSLDKLDQTAMAGADWLIVRTTLQSSTGMFDAIGQLELSKVRTRLAGEGDWLIVQNSDSRSAPADLCRP